MATSSPRHGLSLLEVLISIFIIAIGLLGIATLIPAGRLQLVEVNKSDRTGACGRAAIRDVKVRRMLDFATEWQASHEYSLGEVVMPIPANGHIYQCIGAGTSDVNQPAPWSQDGTNTNDAAVIWRDLGAPSIAIDPLGVTNQLSMNLGGSRAIPDGPPAYSAFPLSRCSLPWGWNAALVDRVFRWSDELTFEPPANSSMRPRTLVRDQLGDVWPYPPMTTDPPMTPPVTDATRLPLTFLNPNEGNFSWFFTATPTQQANVFDMSVVVCHKRLFAMQPEAGTPQPVSERFVDIDVFLGNGFGGGTIQLNPNITVNDVTTPVTSQNFPLKIGQWVMLCGWTPIDISGGGPPDWRRIPTLCHWYRVVGVNLDTAPQYVTLDGPDWPATYQATPPNPPSPPPGTKTTLVVVDGVTGVYSRTIRLDDDVIWRK